MNESMIKSPGVYIDEVNANSKYLVPVSTSIPAFIGYTPQAIYEGKSYTNIPQKIASMAEFKAIYCLEDSAPPTAPAKQYDPQYYLVKQNAKPEKGDYIIIGKDYYSITPDPNTFYYFYNSIRLFFENGGNTAYIVSVGTYGAASGKPVAPGGQITNPNVNLNDLLRGLVELKSETDPTMYVCPEATLLSKDENAQLMQAMIAQAKELETAVCIFDIIGGRDPNPFFYTPDVESFRDNTGVNGLDYGVAYYPFVGTTVMHSTEIDYTNLFGGDVSKLAPLLSPESYPNKEVAAILDNIQHGSDVDVAKSNSALLNASQTYALIIKYVLADLNILPPSGGMAGVYTTNDTNKGVWDAPANVSIVGVTSLPINITDEQQGFFNVDPSSGKSINVIRNFSQRGILVWGARTLDGNSNDWRYINIRRTMTFLEQSSKLAAQSFVFEANDKNTWEAVKAMISNFLTTVWQKGGLQGETAAQAFSVECGLGSTMTRQDISDGIMSVAIKVAITHPAEFEVITFQQQMQQS